MNAVDANNPVWVKLVQKKKRVALNFLAAKILLSRLQLEVEANPSRSSSAAQELFNLYLENQQLPSVKKDIVLILGR